MKQKYFYCEIEVSRKALSLERLDPNRVVTLSAKRIIPAIIRMGFGKQLFVQFILPEEAFLRIKHHENFQQVLEPVLKKMPFTHDIILYRRSP